jgi:CheY-like chemotaxis protein
LEVADRQKNEFLAMLAHELRNPLSPIGSGLQLLKLPGVDPSTVQQTTEMMERQFFHLVRLVDDLLDVSRIITGKFAYEREPVELAEVVNRAVEETRPAIDAGGHELMLSLPARPIVVDGDVLRLSQVVCNLLSNAAKYTMTPSQIWLALERRGDKAIIRIRDSGIGIAKDVLPNIFNLFVQADTSLSRSQGGLGIGLTIVKRIVDLHGGSVMATSEGPGKGSEFIIQLPISTSSFTAQVAIPQAQKSKGPKRRILVVDDNVDAAMTITSLLKVWGHDVQMAYNGQSALEAVRIFKPEVILLDIGLPGMSGYEVAKRLRAEPAAQNAIIAALTGYGQESDRKRSFEAGFDYHFTKPADPTTLEKLLAAPELRMQGLLHGGLNN